MLLKALDHRLHDKRQIGEPDPLALCELLLTALAQSHQTGNVHLDHAPGVRSLMLAPGHPVRDSTSDAREFHDPVAVVNLHSFAPRSELRLWRCFGAGGSLFAIGPRCGITLPDVALDILLRHPTADACARDLLYVYVVLVGEPPDYRGGTRQPQRLRVSNFPASVAAVARLGDSVLLRTILENRLSFGLRGE